MIRIRFFRKVIVVFILVFFMVGCAHNKKEQAGSKVVSGKTTPVESVKPQTEYRPPEMITPEMTASKKPLVKIIRGRAFNSLEEARATAGVEEKRVEGLATRLKKICLKGITVQCLAEVLTEMSGFNVVATTDVAEKTVDIYLQNITLRAALETLCRLNNLWYREGDQVITLMTEAEYTKDLVSRKNERTRAIYVRYTNAADMAKIIEASMGDQVRLAIVENENIYGYVDTEEEADVTTATTDDVKSDDSDGAGIEAMAVSRIESGSPAMVLNPNKRLAVITVSKRNNCIVARSLDEDILTEIEKIVESLDTPTNQVLLEMKILQVTLDDSFESFFSIDYAHQSQTAGSSGYNSTTASTIPGSLASSTLGFLYSNNNIDARIEFYETKGTVDIVASPFLMCANNSKVEFFVGEETPLRDDVTTNTISLGESENTITTFEVEILREELGTDIEISTFINEDMTITLDVDIEISTANLNMTEIGVVNNTTGEVIYFPLDGVDKSEVDSIICAKSDQSVAIGGIIRETLTDTEKKVPFLGDIPFLGYLFKETLKEKKKTEIIVVLTPHIITHPALAGKVSRQFMKKVSSNPFIVEDKETLLDFEDGDDAETNKKGGEVNP